MAMLVDSGTDSLQATRSQLGTLSGRASVVGYLVLLASFCAACEGTRDTGDRIVVERTARGDTIVTTSLHEQQIQRLDNVEVIFRTPELERPRLMELAGETLVIADRGRLHLLDLKSRTAIQFGRRGEGPGEFRSVTGIGVLPADTIAVFDALLHRITLLSTDGALLTTSRIRIRPPSSGGRTRASKGPFVNWRRGGTIYRMNDGVAILMSTNMSSSEEVSTRSALVWHSTSSDSTAVLRSWDDRHFMGVSMRFVAPRSLFSHSLAFATSARREIAWGDGAHYCVSVEPLDHTLNPAAPELICRDWAAIPVGSGIRNPDFSKLPVSDDERHMLYDTHRRQRIPDVMPAYDRLRFDQSGRLWVRAVGSEFADLHPTIISHIPELAPGHRQWDVFDIDRALVASYEFPSEFEPMAMTKTHVYGRFALPSGEEVVGQIAIRD